MEIKQLVIIPPISKPLQKLNEVLESIAVEENIDISIVDDLNELKQFVGSSGQCLMVFSNAKKCATFMQENRHLITLNSSKVVLFTPTEIPSKTLSKFLKIGLTEAILETSAPKTMLYKIKLILRSIKATPKEKDETKVIKKELDISEPDIYNKGSFKIKTDVTVDDAPKEEQSKFKEDEDEDILDYRRKLKKQMILEFEAAKFKSASEQSNDEEELDAYDKKLSERSQSIESDFETHQLSNSTNPLELSAASKDSSSNDLLDDDLEKRLAKEKQRSELELTLADIGNGENKENPNEDENSFYRKSKKDDLVVSVSAVDSQASSLSEEEEKALRKKRDLEELEMLFENARKKQAMELELMEESIKDSEKEEDDSWEKKKKNSSLDPDFFSNENIVKKDSDIEEEKLEASKKEKLNNLEVNAAIKQLPLDDNEEAPLQALRKSDDELLLESIEYKAKKKKDLESIVQMENGKKQEDEQEENLDLADRKRQNNIISIEEALRKDESSEENAENIESKNLDSSDFLLEPALSGLQEKSQNNDEGLDPDENKELRGDLNLKLVDGKQLNSQTEFELDELSIEKFNETNLVLDNNGNKKEQLQQVEQVEDRRNKNKEDAEQNWDNLIASKQQSIQSIKYSTNKNDSTEAQLAKNNVENIIDYRRIKEEFSQIEKNGRGNDPEYSDYGQAQAKSEYDPDDAGSFKVIEVDPRGFLFGVEIIDLIYTANSAPMDFFKKISEELINQYKAYSVFYTFKASKNIHTEAFDSFLHFGESVIAQPLKDWWVATKEHEEIFIDYFQKSTTTWLCRDLKNKNESGKYWEGIELPVWAANELNDKKVELVFPYIDGTDRMGMALLIFPEGINPKMEQSIIVTLELVRTVLLDTIERNVEAEVVELPVAKNNILSKIWGFFKRDKAS